MSRSPTTFLDSNIRVEDALGRMMSLPLEQCRDWKHFCGFLDLSFNETPGQLKVRNRNFGLLSKGTSYLLDWSNWDHAICAGLKVTMVMYVQRSGLLEGTCPSCGNTEAADISSKWTVW